MRTGWLVPCFLFLVLVTPGLAAQSGARPYAVEITVSVQASPAQISLAWPALASTTSFTIYRRAQGSSTWGSAVTTLAASATGYVDSSVSVGTAYEYAVVKNGTPTAYGFATAGIEVAAVHDRGRIVLLCDNTHTATLATELTRLQQDLEGDGWAVIRHDVAPTDTVVSVKALVTAAYNAAPASTRAVLIIGRVPVPYSGNFNPDAHPDHQGAWAADVFYGEMNGTWTDTSVNNTSATRPENRNVPGDGKYDQSSIPGQVELAVGRVDFANMPQFSTTETELLRNWLNKHHEFRHKTWTPQMRAVIDDNFGAFSGEAFAASAWRGFAPMFGPANVADADYFGSTTAGSYMWAYGCGGGSYTSCSGVGTTTNFANASNQCQVAFTCLFGSYFGDWDSQNNLLRASIANGKGLTCCWSGRPHWYWHGMALGETIGETLLYTQNRPSISTYGNQQVHIALMGDPTLRLHVIAPPGTPNAVQNGAAVDLNWAASTDSVLGYHVYRRAGGAWTRLTGTPVTGNSYSDAAPPLGSVDYMVRATRLEQGSGSYHNLSQGVTVTITVTTALPVITLHPQPQTAAPGATATFTVAATGAGLSFQWQLAGVDIPGANSDSYTTPALALTDNGGLYRCVVSNAGGSVTSNEALLTVSTGGGGGGGGGDGKGGGKKGGGGCAAGTGSIVPFVAVALVLVWRRRRR
ncbi:MAG: fibronectin type III domain-containing protein [Planctomycetes bacterium]|nr:fibronectin type III domain-containing protein [Planctomycetota bacterium]